MNKIMLIICVGVLVLSGTTFGGWADPCAPRAFFVSRNAAALKVPFDDPNADLEAVDFGHKSLQQGTWQFLDGVAWTHDRGVARYSTTLEGDAPTVTSMRTDIDWVLLIDYAHTGMQYPSTDEIAWYVKSEPDDIRLVKLAYVGGGSSDLWELAAGNDSGGWDAIPDANALVLGEEFHEFIVHYKAGNQSLDIYLDDITLVTDYELGHGRYDLNFIQLEGISDISTLVMDKYREVMVFNGVREDTGFGRRWVRENPFAISGMRMYNDKFVDNDDFAGTNLNTMVVWKKNATIMEQAERLGVSWHYKAGTTAWTEPEDAATQAEKEYIQLAYRQYSDGTAFMAYDEPEAGDPCEMADAARKTNWFVGYRPDILHYTNAHVMSLNPGDVNRYQDYLDYLDDIVETVNPDVLHCDSYPFELTSGTPPHTPEEILENSYFLHLKAVRSTALGTELPYWVFIQSFEGGGRLFPSESDLRMQIFSSLAYGFTGITYFTYDPIFFPNRSLLDPDYSPNQLYYDAQDVNPEVANVGQALRLLLSTGVGYVVGQHDDGGSPVDNNLPQGTVAWTSGDDPYITDITATNLGSTNDGLAGDVLVGYFTLQSEVEALDGSEYEGEIYFMITNLLRGSSSTAGETQQSVRLDFDFGASGITSLRRLSRDSGLVEEVSLVSDGGSIYHVDLTLDGGTGDLFKFGTGAPFVDSYCDYILTGDLNTDCVVDLGDIGILSENWLECTAPECD